jgi:hypothetical protein
MKLAIKRMGNTVLNPFFLHKSVGNFSFMLIWVRVNIIGINLQRAGFMAVVLLRILDCVTDAA